MEKKSPTGKCLKKILKKIREKRPHPGSKINGGRTQRNIIITGHMKRFLEDTADQKIFQKMREKCLKPGSKMYGGRKNCRFTFSLSIPFFRIEKFFRKNARKRRAGRK